MKKTILFSDLPDYIISNLNKEESIDTTKIELRVPEEFYNALCLLTLDITKMQLQCFYMYFRDGMSYKEIGNYLNIRKESARQFANTARKKIIKRLKFMGNGKHKKE